MIDVTKPLEAVEIATGRIVPMVFKRLHKIGGDKEAIETVDAPDGSTSNEDWYMDGTDFCAQRKWKLRNVVEAHPADWAIQTALSQVTKGTDADGSSSWSIGSTKIDYQSGFAWAKCVFELARMIEKYEPHLALVDPDVLAVREILADRSDAMGYPVDAEKYRTGQGDSGSDFVASLAAYRRVVAARG